MDVETLIKIADSSLAVFAVLFIGWRVQASFEQVLAVQRDIIARLIELCGDEDHSP